jgi:hypothetical protein
MKLKYEIMIKIKENYSTNFKYPIKFHSRVVYYICYYS